MGDGKDSTMKVTGYKFQHALRELGHVSDIAAGQFNDSLKVFPDDVKTHPTEVMARYQAAEAKIAKLQTLQAQYNLDVTVQVQGQPMTLSEAVKLVGGAGRAEKMWRSVAAPKQDRYGGDRDTRDAGVVVAQKVISTEEAAGHAKAAARWASALREAIQVGNATEMEFPVDEALFE
jgi:hypothetical protein